MHRVQIDTGFGLSRQAFHTGFDWTGKEQAVDQRLGHGSAASGVAAFVPGVAHHGYGFLVAHTDELFAIIVTHVGDVKGDVRLARLTCRLDIVRHGHTARRAHGDTVRIAASLLDEPAERLHFAP